MISYLLDTNHVSEMLKRTSILGQRIQASEDIDLGIPVPAIGELWYMVHNSVKVNDNEVHMRRTSEGLRRWGFTELAAVEFGRVKAELRRAGRTIPDVDIQIASIARIHNLTVLTADAHFSFITGIQSENWTM